MSYQAPDSAPATPLRFLMDQAEPLKPAALPVTEAFAFGDVPRLTAALKRGDESAFAWLHGEWSRRINRYCFALAAGDESFAREIAQAAWAFDAACRVRMTSRRCGADRVCARHAESDLRAKAALCVAQCFARWCRLRPAPPKPTNAARRLGSASAAEHDERELIEAATSPRLAGRYRHRHALPFRVESSWPGWHAVRELSPKNCINRPELDAPKTPQLALWSAIVGEHCGHRATRFSDAAQRTQHDVICHGAA